LLAPVNSPSQIGYVMKEAQMETAITAVSVVQSADRTPEPPARGRRLRRGAVGTATALLVGLAAASPAMAAAPMPPGAGFTDWQGSSSSPAGPGGQPWGSDRYGSANPGPSAASPQATAAESAGVVLIDTVLPYQNGQAAGTGMILTSSGQVLTNYHVVQGAGSISVTVAQTGQTYQATVVGIDPAEDVALIQLTGASGLTTIKPDTDAVNIGEQVTAVGNADGTGTLSAATGEITGLDASVTAGSEDGTAPETLGGMLETNANVVAGDSGGPLYDAQGEVVGIDTAGSTGGAPDAYAIPIARALSIVQQIQSGHETSTVRIGPAAFLGIQVASTPSYAGDGNTARGGFATTPGAQVGDVVSGSAAASAGLQAGDVITSLDGQAVNSSGDVSAALIGANPGDHVTIGWTSQDGSQHTAPVTLGASPVA
jgi:S1-C subfamily serine protease